jgi:hypothetical protein
MSGRWPTFPFTIIAAGIALLAAPTAVEGPVLLAIGPGHALSVLDVVGVVPVVAGTCWLYTGLWQRRARLHALAAASPESAGAAIFAAGLGLGLLIASVFSSFFWWWGVGAAILAVALAGVSLAAAR